MLDQASHSDLSMTEMIAEVRRMFEEREPLNISAVKRNHPHLIASAYAVKPFLGWKNLLKAAGIDYGKIVVELLETVECLICGQPMRKFAMHLKMKHGTDVKEYRTEFPNADLVCEALRRHRETSRPRLPHWEPIWSPEYVLDRMAELRERGYKLNSVTLEKDRYDPTLDNYASRYFGSLSKALEALGDCASKHRMKAKCLDLTMAEIASALKQRQKQGLPINARALQSQQPLLYSAAVARFGTFKKALMAANFSPEDIYLSAPKYSSEMLELILGKAKEVCAAWGAERIAKLEALREFKHVVNCRYGGWRWYAEIHGLRVTAFARTLYGDQWEIEQALNLMNKNLTIKQIRKIDPYLYYAIDKFGIPSEFLARYRARQDVG